MQVVKYCCNCQIIIMNNCIYMLLLWVEIHVQSSQFCEHHFCPLPLQLHSVQTNCISHLEGEHFGPIHVELEDQHNKEGLNNMVRYVRQSCNSGRG
jgi:hypothetical protein